ncbi:MAG: PEP-CTERM sorting domain-containing protein [Limisphaerales bacterium]|jgi:hypothetical protein
MKKILTIAAAFALVTGAYAQTGTITFNTSLDVVNGPFVFDVDGITKLDSNSYAQVFAGADANSLASVSGRGQFGVAGGSPNATFNGIVLASQTLTSAVNGANGQGAYQIRAWTGNHADYATAVAAGANHGVSDVVTGLVFGGFGAPPSLPPNVDGFTSFALIPEPTTVALGLLGLGGLVASRRRKNA